MLKRDLGLWMLVVTFAASSAHAQLTSLDGGVVLEDNSGLVVANTIGTGLDWLSGTDIETTAQWDASLNAEDYGGYNDWTVATGIGTDAPNTTTNQLAQIFQTDCGNAAGGLITTAGCSSFTSLTTALQGESPRPPGYQIFFSSSLYGTACCDIYSTYWWAYITEPALSSQAPWNFDTDLAGRLEDADAIAVREANPAPELNLSNLAGALLFLLASFAVAMDRARYRTRSSPIW
jgi:hypothetical protein